MKRVFLPKCAQLVLMGVWVCSERGWEGEGFVPFQQSVRCGWGLLLFTPSLFQVLWALGWGGNLTPPSLAASLGLWHWFGIWPHLVSRTPDP